MDWTSTNKLINVPNLDDHHIYPSAYINSSPTLDVEQGEAEQLVDCVINRTLIPKITNIKIGKKPPQTYLSEIRATSNPNLENCLPSHQIPKELISDAAYNGLFKLFLEDRAKAIFGVMNKYANKPRQDIITKHGFQSDEIS